MIVQTYSIAEVAAMICGDSMADPVLWLRRQILAGRITARKVGRHWRFTTADVDHALAALANTTTKTTTAAPAPTAVTPPTPLSAGSLRRRSAAPTADPWWERHPAWKATQR